jgi:hypothetical protein
VKGRLDPLLVETGIALLATSCLAAVIALIFWLTTGLSPWPFVVLGEMVGLGFGISLLALTSPRRRP